MILDQCAMGCLASRWFTKNIFLWHLEAKHPIGIGRNREKVGKSYYENALTLSARFGAKLKNTSVDLTYVKFQVISSSNQLKN